MSAGNTTIRIVVPSGSPHALFANPGQTVRLVIQTINSDGYRVDSYVPVVTSIYYPNLALASGYPIAMTKIETGLYVHGLIIPTGATAIGTFIANVYYEEAGAPCWEVFTIQVARPFGNSSVVPL